ncbi:Fic family protein [Candidatus Saccharibacteria bacterium]|nr:Fic family protein [Candidatus Saccharibacteria bacterium]
MATEERSLESTTRTFDTTKGKLTYAELSDLIAPKLLQLLDDITDCKFINHSFDEDLIKNFHFRIIGDIIPGIAGKWRNVPVQVGNWLPPEPYEIPIKMHEYVANMQARLDKSVTLDLQIETLAYAEGEFLHVHPFQDFNGRTIRAILSELLMRFDLPLVDTAVKRETPEFRKYQNALAEYDNGRIVSLIEL